MNIGQIGRPAFQDSVLRGGNGPGDDNGRLIFIAASHFHIALPISAFIAATAT